jgi:hypothetical protein
VRRGKSSFGNLLAEARRSHLPFDGQNVLRDLCERGVGDFALNQADLLQISSGESRSLVRRW